MELNQPADQVIAVEAKFDLTSDQNVGMEELRKLRGAMWDQNVPFLELRGAGNTRLRDVAANYGLDTRDKYVNAIQVDTGYNLIALQRATEAAEFMGHDRPHNSTCAANANCGSEATATINGKGGYGTNLHSTSNISRAMQGWGFGELVALKRLGGAFSADQRNLSGHLHTLINPANTRIGFAGVVTAEGEASAAAVGSEATGVTVMPQGEQTTVLHRPANSGEKPSTTPKKLILGGASMSEIRRIISIVLTVLTIASALVKFIEPQLRPLVDQYLRR